MIGELSLFSNLGLCCIQVLLNCSDQLGKPRGRRNGIVPWLGLASPSESADSLGLYALRIRSYSQGALGVPYSEKRTAHNLYQ